MKNLDLFYTRDKQSSPVFEHVRTVLLIDNFPWWPMKTLNFIRHSFPNIRTLYFHSRLTTQDWNYIGAFNERFPELFADDFLNNTQI